MGVGRDVKRRWSVVAVVASAACFGTLAILTPLAYRSAAEPVSPLALLTWRFVLAGMLLAVVASLRRRGSLAVSKADIGRYATLALTGYGAASVCFFYALTFADASVVAVLLYAYPALVAIASWTFLGARRTPAQVVAVIVTFLGCALVVGIGSGENQAAWQGVALGLGAAVGYTLFNLLSARWLPGRDRLAMMAFTFSIAALLPAVGAIATGGLAALSVAAWTSTTWVLLAAIVLVPTFAAIVLYLEGIAGLGPAQAAVISTLEPLFTVALAAWVLGERLTPTQLVGAVLVLIGVVAAEIGARMVEPPAPT